MSRKLGWIGVGVGVCVFGMSGTLQSQPGREAERQDLRPDETEVTILQEKVDAFTNVYRQVKVDVEAGGKASHSDLNQAGCQLSLAKAELARAAGKPGQQIQSLQEALKFAEDYVKNEESRREHGLAGSTSPDLYLKAVVLRADVKLALLRAKKKPASH